MNRKDTAKKLQYLLIILLFLSTITVIVFGNIYFEQRNKNQAIAANIEPKTNGDQGRNKDQGSNEENSKSDVANLKLLESLVSESKQYGSARISVLGSSISEKSPIPKEKLWVSLLQNDLQTNVKGLEQLSYMLTDYDSLTTSEILE
ncbi:hypothetical protein [Tepidibacillus fermentans]|uniref:Uncharacterized protein n=1 Tax=Tepidibacillus fermentans TaxID=1281767 RepID=A0A4R3KJC5_9BACI|nr:hypothetical protein [Tepidibacillus fermentans]TCS83271.1 hypothetical protein EDD72_1059 [Tepidibacillus fermentans]